MNAMQKSINRLADATQRAKDQILKDQIDAMIGDSWELNDLKGRLVCIDYKGLNETCYFLDRRPLVMFRPAAFDCEGNKIGTSFTYQKYPSDSPPRWTA